MARHSSPSRFAAFNSEGDLDALVAEGLPEYPADGNLSALTDEQIGEIHDALLASVPTLSEDPGFNPEDAVVLADRIEALRAEAGTRIAAAEGDLAPTDPPAADPPAPAANADDRAAALERLAGLTDPAPVVDPSEPTDPPAVGPGLSAADITTAVTAAAPAIAEAAVAAVQAAAPMPVHTGRVSARDLGGFRPPDLAPSPETAGLPSRRGRLLSAGDNGGFAMGAELKTVDDVVTVMRSRQQAIGRTTSGVEDEKVVVATLAMDDPPPERDLRNLGKDAEQGEIRSRIRRVLGRDAMGIDPWTFEAKPIGRGGIAVSDPDALVASGGLAAPVEPYYPQLNISESTMPFMDAMPGFTAERGGIRLVSPASIGTLAAATVVGQFADGVENGTTTFTSATADFTASDLGQPIVGPGIPAGTIISAIGSTTSITLSAAATATATGVTFRLPSRNPNNLGPAVGLVTAAQDAAGPPNTVKFTYDVPDGTQVEFDVYSVYASLQYANLTARTFPEQVELNVLLANALAARVSEQAAMDLVTAYSALVTGAKTFGTARQLLAQLEHMAAYLRNAYRMDPEAVLRVGLPAWALNAMRADYISTFIGGNGSGGWGLSDEELTSWFQDRHLLPFFYMDGPSDISQVFPSIGSGAINNGVNTATPVSIPDYPGTGSTSSFRTNVISYMWPEGQWLGLTTGELNIGLVRDSILNSQNRFRNFEEKWVTPAMVGPVGASLRGVHTVAADGTYGAAASVVLGAGNGL